MSAERLIERDEALAELRIALARVASGRGELALITGEAGAGKTSTIAAFVAQAAGRPVVLRGTCDPLSTPRPLGPLIDAVTGVDSTLARRLEAGATRAEAFAAALALVDGTHSPGRTVVFVVEDAHWADEATLDMLTFLGRRISNFPALLVVSFRADEVGVTHPLRGRLGELGSVIRCRIELPALSPSGVAELARGSGLDAADLHRMTGGNPFFVTEVLDSGVGPGALPESVRDAVLARAASLPGSARAVLDAAAVVPGRVEPWLLRAVAGPVEVDEGLEICLERGTLRLDQDGAVVFRHELARLAIVGALGGVPRRQYHSRALAALRRPPIGRPSASRLAFHAAEADDSGALLEHAVDAAAEAAAIGAHHQAAAHLRNALRHQDRIGPHEVAGLLLQLGGELTTIGESAEAVSVYDLADELYADHDDDGRRVEAVVGAQRPLVALGRQTEALGRLERAAALAEVSRSPRDAGRVATSLCALYMLARQFDLAEREGQRAIALAEQCGDDDMLAEACIQSGISLVMSGDDSGLARTERGIALASGSGNDRLVVLGRSQIGSGLGELRRYTLAVPTLRDGIAFASAREHVSSLHYMSAWLGRCELELGHWSPAGALADDLVGNPRCGGISRFVALVTLGWLRGRRGDPGVEPVLDEALALARATGHLQRLWPIAACRAEIAWLNGRLDDETHLLEEVSALATGLGYHRAVEELDHWRYLADGEPRPPRQGPATPFALSAAGRPDLAAREWAVLGCPYEQAVAEFLTGGVDALRSALRTFDELGAGPMRLRAAAALRAAGAAVPRGPRRTTRDNPQSLTDRELDVLMLVGDGRTDRDIAGQLGISVKTVGHHVSAVLRKLGARDRRAAVQRASELGIVPET